MRTWKRLLPVLLALLLLTGCTKPAPQAPAREAETTAATTQPAAQDPSVSAYVIRERIYYDSQDRQQIHLLTTFNEMGLPEKVVIDSGTDVVFVPEYDENGTITAFTMTKTLYEEETLSRAVVNDHGDTTQKITNNGENVLDLRYTYDEQGRIIGRDQHTSGRVLSCERWEYDEHGQKTAYSLDNRVNAADSRAVRYENTYDSNRLIQVVCSLDGGDISYTEHYEYDPAGLLLKKERTAGAHVTVTAYTYNENGLLEIMTVSEDGTETERSEFTYDENGCIAQQRSYVKGVYKGRTEYTCVGIEPQLTAAQLKIYKQFSIIPE